MNTVLIWYLLVFGIDYNTSQKIPEPTRDICIQQAAAINGWFNDLGYSTRSHAYCVQGLPENASH